MLSILIPVYNYDVTPLVTELHRQCTEQYVDFEIVVAEDGSKMCVDKNASIHSLPNCRHIILKENIGRSAIRNRLADEARYEHLLFMYTGIGAASARYRSFRSQESGKRLLKHLLNRHSVGLNLPAVISGTIVR